LFGILRGHPLHPMLVTVPIGTWVASLVFDIASHMVRRPLFLSEGSQWLIAIGLLVALAAMAAGLIDLVSVTEAAFPTARTHMIINILVTFAYAGNFAWRARTHAYGVPVSAGMMGLSAVCVIGLSISGYLGGKLTHGYQVRATAPAAQAIWVQGNTAATGEHRSPGASHR